MTKLHEVVDPIQVELDISAGYINRRTHPEFPELAILNYSDSCQFDGYWTETTTKTRGLIYDMETGDIVARGFNKFFNHTDTARTGELDLTKRIYCASDKADGSLGIGYMRPDGKPAIATRGSFESDQAIHAAQNLTPEEALQISAGSLIGITPLYEIIYPENRIVLDYGDRDELIPLGMIYNEGGGYMPAPGSDEVRFETLGDVLSSPPRPNAEGWVVWLDELTAIKIKQEDYLALHRVISSLSRKEVWRQLSADTYGEWAPALPDEFHDWANATMAELVSDYMILVESVDSAYGNLLRANPEGRKAQAMWIMENVSPKIRGLVFSRLDNRDIAPALWKMVEPMGAGL